MSDPTVVYESHAAAIFCMEENNSQELVKDMKDKPFMMVKLGGMFFL